MPKLTKDTQKSEIFAQRAVRVGDGVFYSENSNALHRNIAIEEAGVTEFDDDNRPVVDDAGFLKILRDGSIVMDGSSSSTCIKPNLNAREITNMRIVEIRGERSS